jgi:putative heme-binding domain-containing protein
LTRLDLRGNSFKGFLNNIRNEALTNCVTDAAERTALDALSKQPAPAAPVNMVMPKGPGKDYSVDDVVALAKDGLKGRNFAQGKAMFTSQLCINCHHFGGDGGNSGPDLTGSGSRYSVRDLAENIIEPSKVISDQYPTEQLTLKDGSVVVGRVVVEENGKLFVMSSALAPDALTTVDETNVKSRQPFNVSMMPPGMINALNKDELLDLFAYILSGGNPKDARF